MPKWKDLGHRSALAHELECIAFILIRKEEPLPAAVLFGAAEALRERIDSVMTRLEQEEYEKEISALRAIMDEVEYEKSWSQGRAMTPDQAIKYASEAVPVKPG